MAKRKKKPSGRGGNKTQNKRMLMGISVLAVVFSLVFSVYYIIHSRTGNTVNNEGGVNESIGLGGKTSVIDKSFKQSATYLGTHCSGVCHMAPRHKKDILVKYNGDIIISGDVTSGGHHFTDHLDKNLKIPAGKYAVKLESFDSYTNRKDTNPAGQKEEQYRIVFKNGSAVLAKTKKTGDLPDGVDEAGKIYVVNGPNNPIVLPQDTSGITIQHVGTKSAGDAGNLNGFEPVCMLLERIDDPEPEPEPAPAPKPEPGCKASIGDYIWYDTNSNGVQDDIEEGISGIKVCAYKGNKKHCDTTNKHGKYKIKNLCAGKYEVKVKGVDKMIQTYDPDSKKDNKTKVKLKDKKKYTKADFGYRGAAPKTGLGTNIILLLGLSTLITIVVLLIMRKKHSI